MSTPQYIEKKTRTDFQTKTTNIHNAVQYPKCQSEVL